jgi:hypothetical protein
MKAATDNIVLEMLKPLSAGSNKATTKGELLMKKLRSTLLSLTILLALCLTVSPIQVRADPSGGPQNTSNSQSSGGSSLTLAQIVAIAASMIRLW